MSNNDATYQVTEWGLPDDNLLVRVRSQRGADHALVRYEQWLGMEIQRWAENANGRESWVQTNTDAVALPDGRFARPKTAIALFSWREYQKPVVGEE